jgi:Ca-activated chloride channel family protein
MRSEDKISAIQFADKAEVIADAISAANMDEIKLKIDKLSSTGQSDIIAGLQLGYELAKKHFSPEANNRIIITTDGDLSFDTQDKLRTFLKKKHDENIVFTILLFNNSSIYYQQLQQIADEVGSQIFVVNPENIEEILLNEFRAKKQ